MNRLRLALAIWFVFGLVCLISEYAHAKDIPPGLSKVMAEGSGRALGYSQRGAHWTLTCDDVRAIVERVGEAQAIAAAQAYGAGETQIAVARQCLTKKVKK